MPAEPASHTAPTHPTTTAPPTPAKSLPTGPLNHLTDTILTIHSTPMNVGRPFIFPNTNPTEWHLLQNSHAVDRFRNTKFEYLSSGTLVVVPLAKPFHDFAVPLMNNHIKMDMLNSGLATRAQIRTLKIDRQNMTKGTGSGSTSNREPDCAVWTPAYVNGVVPTIVWEVGHTQKRQSLFRRAKMWCRRYDGMVRVVFLVKYQRRNPHVDKAAILMVYRPSWRGDKWTALQDGPVYQLFPRPQNIVPGSDAVPLTYQDYFGPGNIGVDGNGEEINPDARFDLPLERVREEMEDILGADIHRGEYRYPSGGSSNAAVVDGGTEEIGCTVGQEQPGREDSVRRVWV